MAAVGGVSLVQLQENVGVEVKNSAPIPVTVTNGGDPTGPQDVNVINFPTNQAVSGNVGVNNFPANQSVRDIYTGGEALPDQTAAGATLTFTFSSPVQLVYVFFKTTLANGSGRADPFGGTASPSQGIPLDDGVPQAIPVQTSSVSVFATAGAPVSVWGFRYA